MWREKRHQEKLETLLKKSLYKYTTDHIWVIREKFPKKKYFDNNFENIK